MREQCPKCGTAGIRRASSFPRHLGRIIIRSKKRFCPACKEKWHVAPAVPREILKTEEKLAGAFVLTTLIVLALATHPYFIRDWVKTQIRSYYDEKYGPDSEAHLWNDLGKYYLDKKPAINDYGTHGKK